MDIHEFCAEIVNMVGEYPEITMASWVTSAMLAMFNATLFVRYLFSSKVPVRNDYDEVEQVYIPYVPGDTVLKTIKLLKEQETGWRELKDNALYEEDKGISLSYGNNLIITKRNYDGEIAIKHKETPINLNKVSREPQFDQTLLRDAFMARLKAERYKTRKKLEQLATDAENHANREISLILDSI